MGAKREDAAVSPFDMARAQLIENRCDSDPCSACAVRFLTVCDALDAADLDRLAEIVQTVTIEAGDVLFDEAEPASAMYNVTQGTLKLYKLLPDGRRQITGFLTTGDFLGLSVEDSYAYTAQAVTDATLCRFPRAKLEHLLADFPKLQRRLFALAANELAAAQDQMLLLGRKTAREKICSFLVGLADKAARRGLPSNPVDVPMTRSDIADYLGLTTETVSRTFTQLKASQVIQLIGGNKVRLIDAMNVEALADGE